MRAPLDFDRDLRREMCARLLWFCTMRVMAGLDEVDDVVSIAIAVDGCRGPAYEPLLERDALDERVAATNADEEIARSAAELLGHALAIAGADDRDAPLFWAADAAERLALARFYRHTRKEIGDRLS